jgi:FdhD protein
MNERATITMDIVKVNGTASLSAGDVLAIEEPLEIQLSYQENGAAKFRKVSVTMRTPGNDAELGAGFLFTEGILKSKQEIESIEKQENSNEVLVHLAEGVLPELKNTERNFYTTSSCGVCGKSSIDAIKTTSVFAPSEDAIYLDPEVIYSLPDKLRLQQEIFDSTGGLHASALFDLDGNFITLREDVGRHNALDKIIGSALLSDKLPLNETILLLSGRASFELVQKAAMAGIKIIAAVGAPSSLAVSLAAESDITLIGFLRAGRFNVYTHTKRINIQHTT